MSEQIDITDGKSRVLSIKRPANVSVPVRPDIGAPVKPDALRTDPNKEGQVDKKGEQKSEQKTKDEQKASPVNKSNGDRSAPASVPAKKIDTGGEKAPLYARLKEIILKDYPDPSSRLIIFQ
ncbi:hypothetical protein YASMINEVIRUS_655 [Yasminevirus sp. GU-2018]|uniref:Uncharacterized protein n=1 Tax=Yasminevirus sp. GU-2018 TaxID=2420051 RepID=A0A5K0U9P8_9VIRU|nr:hypothetical protein YASMINEVIRUS_655 [Yasminevirus sp. GU-2018]